MLCKVKEYKASNNEFMTRELWKWQQIKNYEITNCIRVQGHATSYSVFVRLRIGTTCILPHIC